jgi:hypothetical protein
MATLYVRDDDLKMLREALCASQALIGRSEQYKHHSKRLGQLIDEIDIHRPLGSDGKHGSLHTPTCGCEDKV